ncbi:MAG: threonine/serine exporter family protein [Clostridiales bacterium]|nr:threonine/serine exporter family protein [Clostridiales bacterium]
MKSVILSSKKMEEILKSNKESEEMNHDAEINETGILALTTLAGELLLKNGSEIFRVQDTILRILDACGCTNRHVYVLSNAIFISLNEGMDDPCTAIRYVPLGTVNLSRIAEINEISRGLCEGRFTRDEAMRKLEKCKKPWSGNPLFMTIACGIGAGSFSILFGGGFAEGFVSFFIGFFLQVMLIGLQRTQIPPYLIKILVSIFIPLGAFLPLAAGFSLAFDKIVIGSIIPLVPGYVFTTSIRDFFNSDYLSGIIHLIDSILTAVCIAVGVGLAIVLIQRLGGGIYL